MSNELDQRISELREEMEQLEKQKQIQGMQGEEEKVKKRILELQEISRDPYYDAFLGQLLRDLENKKAAPSKILGEAERNYAIYRQRMNRQSIQAAATVYEPADEKTAPVRRATDLEFNIGAGLLSIVGALFLLIAFITFGVNFLNGIAQGIFLYIISGTVIMISELLLQRKIPKFARGITGLGIAGLYASTIINYLYLEVINSLTALIITIFIAVFSILISRKKDSVSLRIISFVGCYICFFPIGEFKNDWDFLVAAGIIFLVNLISIFFPNQNNRNRINLIHMGLNTFFALVFSIIGKTGNVAAIYIILYLLTNVILLNIVFLKQEEQKKNTIFFCVELGIFGMLTYIFAADVFLAAAATSLGIYYRLITLVLSLAICMFFYVMNHKRKERWIQYYYFMMTALLLLVFSNYELENLFGVLGLFIIAKCLYSIEEVEIANVIITIFAFIIGLSYHDMWQAWILFGAFALSAFCIKRWKLFYQYIISLFLVCFIAANTTFNIFIPLCAAMLSVLFWVFNLSGRKKREDNIEDKIQKVYNITNMCFMGLFSLLAIFCRHYLAGTITMIIGAIYIILYISPQYLFNIKKKYLVLAGYLTVMAFLTGYKNPVITSSLLMVIAVSCVAVGFKIKDKTQRLCGLVLAVFVCAKLMIYDFREMESLQRIILFMIVGIIALVISLIYIRLEKNQNAEEEIGEQELINEEETTGEAIGEENEN